MKKRVCVILPALNEENTIGLVIDEIPREELEKRGYSTDIMVVNNGSTDRTGEIARGKGVQVVEESKKGKGRAIRAGFETVDCDFVFMLDSDYTYPAVHIPAMLEVLEGGCDVVMGSRLKGHIMDGAMSNLNRLGNRLLAVMTNVLYGTKISDPCTGCWGLRADVVKGLKLEANGFDIEVEICKCVHQMAGTLNDALAKDPSAKNISAFESTMELLDTEFQYLIDQRSLLQQSRTEMIGDIGAAMR